ncbi:hypothetical protein CC78DRAFT_575617 [Lojkania enalia]|uniref:Uncharacterized protein n=1 Tax=Lojkania enalia TaxID=147567 RepID=A0A9P4TNG6_9PLEO|nr:hypothetical protein CC78DRAFT_575617 [Didymosphaeria enalia]
MVWPLASWKLHCKPERWVSKSGEDSDGFVDLENDVTGLSPVAQKEMQQYIEEQQFGSTNKTGKRTADRDSSILQAPVKHQEVEQLTTHADNSHYEISEVVHYTKDVVTDAQIAEDYDRKDWERCRFAEAVDNGWDDCFLHHAGPDGWVLFDRFEINEINETEIAGLESWRKKTQKMAYN